VRETNGRYVEPRFLRRNIFGAIMAAIMAGVTVCAFYLRKALSLTCSTFNPVENNSKNTIG